MKPLYMWAGGKNKMIPKYLKKSGIPYSGYDTYVEPFFGGGAMMIHIAQHNPNVKKFVLNDINKEIIGLYIAIKKDVDNFIDRCNVLTAQYLPLSHSDRKKYFYDLRKTYTTQYQDWTSTEESATLYFLMKTAFNGIWQSTKEAKGRFCTPCGLLNHTNYVVDESNVREWNKFLQRVDIWSGDWKDCVDSVKERAFYFFDPPYRASFTQYDKPFTDQQHVALMDFCKMADLRGDLVMYCNREAGDDFYTKNQGQLILTYYDIVYTAGRRATDDTGDKSAKSATEILLSSPAITTDFDRLFD
jgi:DNA adenine methylase